MKILLAFDSFKGSMSAKEACRAASLGLKKSFPEAEIINLPISDGGEGLVDCLTEALNAEIVTVKVHGPLMHEIDAHYAISSDGQTAYMEMAAASGLTLVPIEKRNPMFTTTYGVGEMLLDAVDRGCKHVVMGIGGSATCDGGKGMVECLKPYLPLPVDILVASDVTNPLYGLNGAAYVFGPQKGATSIMVVKLDEGLRRFARETESLGLATPTLANHPGAGAAGGLGYALMAYLGAELRSGIDLVLDTVGFDKHLKGTNFILTGEGKSDAQTLMGKVPMGVLLRAKHTAVPVHLLSGCIEDREALIEAGFASVASINKGDERPLEILMKNNVAFANMRRNVKCALQNQK